jgi:hypothetical protein
MQIPKEIRDCVVFVCYKNINGIRLAGTAFFVGVELEGTERSSVYLITAKHIIDKIQKESGDKKVYLRMNMKSEGAKFIETQIDRWVFHPQESNVDVAALNWAPPEEKVDYLFVPMRFMATDDVIKEENIGVGDDVFLVGLFPNHFGSQRNLPIIRVGNIASMPDEKVRTEDYGDIDAYLVEARSIGGLSGSPVFAYAGQMRKIRDAANVISRRGRPLFYLLGIMHGHFELSKLEIDNMVEDSLANLKINIGIAVVVPTWKILEVINQEVFMKQRQKEREKLMEKAVKDIGR